MKVSPRLGPNPPAIGGLVVMRRGDTAVEQDVPLQIEPVRDMVKVTHDFRLAGIALGPLPLAHQVG